MIDVSFLLIFLCYMLAVVGVLAFVVYFNSSNSVMANFGDSAPDIRQDFRRAAIMGGFCLIPSLIATLAIFNTLTFAESDGTPLYLERLFLVVFWTIFFYVAHRRAYESP